MSLIQHQVRITEEQHHYLQAVVESQKNGPRAHDQRRPSMNALLRTILDHYMKENPIHE